MYKLLLFLLMAVIFSMLYALQADEEQAMYTLFYGKRGLNQAVHAAAQQTDLNKLARGVHAIDAAAAATVAGQYLRANLQLDGNNDPLPGTFLRTQVRLLDLAVLNDNLMYPYTYTEYAAWLHRYAAETGSRSHYSA